jgi:virginiamycin B lyase
MRRARTLVAALAAIATTAAVGAAPAAADIWWGSLAGTSIGHASSDGSTIDRAITNLAFNPNGVATDGRHVYWSDIGLNAISRVDADGGGVRRYHIRADSPLGVAIDGRYLYWTQANDGAIGRARLDGSEVDPRFIAGARAGRGIAVTRDFIYWGRTSGGVARATINGVGTDASFLTGIPSPGALAVDDEHLYVADSGNLQIGRAALDGSSYEQAFVNRPASGLAVDDGRLYWTDQFTDAIGRVRLDGTDLEPLFINGAGTPVGIAAAAPLVRTLNLSASSLSFPAPQVLETFSAPAAVTVTATGTGDVTLGSAQLTGNGSADFLLTGDDCSRRALRSGETCTLSLRFAPVMLGARSAELSLGSDAGEGTLRIGLAGTAIVPAASGGTGGPGAGTGGSDDPAGRQVTRTRCVTHTLTRPPAKKKRRTSGRGKAAPKPKAAPKRAAAKKQAARKRKAAAKRKAARRQTVERKRCTTVVEPRTR